MSGILTPGQTFAGRYRIERFLAQGGFGAVYVAEQIETELKVALKVLWPHVLNSDEAVEKFKLEARVAGRVGSDHIVKIFDAGFDETTRMPFLVMELLKGDDLEAVTLRAGVLTPDQVVAYFRQIASALDRAHGYVDRDGKVTPIIHRDLKPENLFLTHRETGEAVVKILDFGIAKVLGDSAKMSQEVKGTPLYMAYEQAAGGAISPQTDVWALGLIAFFLLTGRPYWKSASLPEASVTQLFGEVLSLPIEPPSLRATALGVPVVLPGRFDEWFARCVDRDPRNRFGSAGECATQLGKVFSGTNTLPGPGTRVDALGTTSHSPGASASPAISGTESSLSLDPTKVSAGAHASKRSPAPLILTAVAAIGVLGGVAMLSLRRSSAEESKASPSAAVAMPATATASPSASAVAAPLPAATAPPLEAPSSSASPPRAAAPVAIAPKARPKVTSPAPLPASPPAPAKKTASDLYSDR